MDEKKIRRVVLLIIIISALVRSFFAATLDLGNDEVYYITYALYPDWSHFDHPPMVGWMIKIFTANNYFDGVYFIRLAAIVLGAASAWLVYLLARLYGSPRSGLLAVVLITASIYTSIISGVFILPDTPQIFFWLLALYCFSFAIRTEELDKRTSWYLIAGGLFTGLAVISKYTSVFIWLGVLLFILIYRRNWFKKKSLYLAMLVSLSVQVPVIIWNIQNHFISFTYQGGRVAGLSHLRLDYFFTELIGEIFYNNPVNFFIIGSALYLFFISRRLKVDPKIYLVLCVSLPLVITFWFLSLFHSTLPHWTGPAFTSLIVFASVVFDQSSRQKDKVPLVPKAFRVSLILAVVFVTLGYLQITRGIITRLIVPSREAAEDVSWDISLDMYGWKQLKKAMPELYKNDLVQGRISKDPFLISWRWFPAANLDYYVAKPMGLKLFAFGALEQIHKYYWINKIRGPIPYGEDAYFICTNRDKKNPGTLFRDQFHEYSLPDTVPVFRAGRQVMEFYIYRLRKYKFADPPVKSSFGDLPIR